MNLFGTIFLAILAVLLVMFFSGIFGQSSNDLLVDLAVMSVNSYEANLDLCIEYESGFNQSYCIDEIIRYHSDIVDVSSGAFCENFKESSGTIYFNCILWVAHETKDMVICADLVNPVDVLCEAVVRNDKTVCDSLSKGEDLSLCEGMYDYVLTKAQLRG